MEIDYSAVLADLKARRAKLDTAIEAIGQIIGSGALAESGVSLTGSTSGGIAEDTFFDMPVLDAAVKYLAIVKKPQTATEIAEGLERGGFTHSSKTFASTVYTILKREYDKDGEITKMGRGKWALAAWYPGRRNKKASRSAADGADVPAPEDSDLTESPSPDADDSIAPQHPDDQSQIVVQA